MITVSDLIEYQFCQRFIFYMHCIKINQNEGNRFKIQKGREVHKEIENKNKNYLRKKLNVTQKHQEVYLSSIKLGFVGVIDEVLEHEDGSLSPLDYKFAEYKEKMFTTYKYQSCLYSILIQEHYNKTVNKGYICYTRSSNLIKEIEYSKADREKAIRDVSNIHTIINTGYFPKSTSSKAKCNDCCYRNICIK